MTLGCPGRDTGTAGVAAPSHPVVIALRGTLDSLNPYLSTQALSRDLAFQIYEPLAQEQPALSGGAPAFRPGLATAWEFAQDGMSLTFHLRPSARWSDGQPVTAEDVRFTWQASIHPDVAWLSADTKRFIRDVEIVDDQTVRVQFTRVYPWQLMDANEVVILPRHVWSAVPFRDWRTSGLDRHPVGSGPFQVTDWRAGDAIEMVARADLEPERRPGLDRVVFRFAPDAAAGLEQFLAGQFDVWDRLEPRDVERTERAGAVLHRFPDTAYTFIAWNCTRPQFADARVRQALTIGIDRNRIVRDILRSAGEVAAGPLPPDSWARHPDLRPHEFAPDTARRLLREAGWIDHDADGWVDRGGRALRFELQINAESPIRQDIAVLVQDDLRRIGIDARPVTLEWNAFQARHREGNFDAFIMSWRTPTRVDLATTFHSRSIGEGHNYGGWRDEEFDRLSDEADAAPTLDAARPALLRAQEILHEEQPYTWLFRPERVVATQPRLTGVAPNALSPLFGLEAWRLSADARP